MSRSYKHMPCYDMLTPHKKNKKFFNRRIRRNKDLDLPSGGRYRRMCESWEIQVPDGRFYYTSYERLCEWAGLSTNDKEAARFFHSCFLNK